MVRPDDQLRPNYSLLHAMAAAAGSGSDVIQLLEGWGLEGVAKLVLPAASLTLGSVLSQEGATGQVYNGKLNGNTEVSGGPGYLGVMHLGQVGGERDRSKAKDRARYNAVRAHPDAKF
jgi:hypothetical protein